MAGFRPIQDMHGSRYTGKTQAYYVDSGHATLLAVGDAVLETGVANSSTGMAGVDAITAGSLISGYITGIDFNPMNINQQGLPAGTGGVVFVAPATAELLLEAEVDSSGITDSDVGANADVVATAATLTGNLAFSNMVINGSSYGSSTAQIRIVGLKDGNTGPGATVICRTNESTVFGTVGV